MNNEDTRPADIRGHTAQSEQSEAAVAITRNEFDTSMEAIMAVYKEIAERNKETSEQMKETSEQIKEMKALVEATSEQMKQTDAKIKKTSEQIKATDKQMKASDKKLNKMYKELNGNWSRLVESLVSGKLVELLQSRGVDATGIFPNIKTHYIDDDGNRRDKEFDIVVRNGTDVVAFEVKTTLREKDVTKFIGVMRDISRYLPEYASKRAYGGVAYVREESDAGRYAAKQGLYVIRATGDSASIVNNAEFKPVSFTNATSAPVRGHLRAVPEC